MCLCMKSARYLLTYLDCCLFLFILIILILFIFFYIFLMLFLLPAAMLLFNVQHFELFLYMKCATNKFDFWLLPVLRAEILHLCLVYSCQTFAWLNRFWKSVLSESCVWWIITALCQRFCCQRDNRTHWLQLLYCKASDGINIIKLSVKCQCAGV